MLSIDGMCCQHGSFENKSVLRQNKICSYSNGSIFAKFDSNSGSYSRSSRQWQNINDQVAVGSCLGFKDLWKVPKL